MISNQFMISNCFDTLCDFILNNAGIVYDRTIVVSYKDIELVATVNMDHAISAIIVRELKNKGNYILVEPTELTVSDIGDKLLLEIAIESIENKYKIYDYYFN